jgi:hypothetical protein
MNRTSDVPLELTQEERDRLRADADAALRAIEHEFAGRSWIEVAPAYFAAQRTAGQTEMAALLAALGVAAPIEPEAAGPMLAEAARIYLGTRSGAAELTVIQNGVHVLHVGDCPLYERLLEERPHHQPDGMTACSCTYRRRGWYDVLGIVAWDEPQTNMKWGDPYCSVVITVA